MSPTVVHSINVSGHGLWLYLNGQEAFLPFTDFPWFREATIAQITQVELLSPRHLYWPALDLDLAVESIFHPEQFPLVSRLNHESSHP